MGPLSEDRRCVQGIKYTCPNGRLTENVFKRIFANSNPNTNPNPNSKPNPNLKHKNVFEKTK